MNARNLGRALVILSILGVVLSMAWWATYYNAVVQALGPKPALTHPMRCLLWTADICVQPQAAAKVQNIPPYNPLALLGSLAVLVLGLLVVARSRSPYPYPATPPGEPKLFVPKLEPFYAWVRDLSWPLIRIAAGGTLLGYGITKVTTGNISTFGTRSMAGRGLEPGWLFAYIVYFLETGGAILIMLGLFTRFFASVIAIQMFIIVFVAQFTLGYSTARGWNLLMMWGLIFFAIALRGGGPCSLDRAIRREL